MSPEIYQYQSRDAIAELYSAVRRQWINGSDSTRIYPFLLLVLTAAYSQRAFAHIDVDVRRHERTRLRNVEGFHIHP